MKTLKTFTASLLLLISISITAQQGINYKALIKDGGGNIVASQSIDIQFIIYQGPGEATNVYQETHNPTTDANGIVIVNIGEGTIDSGVYADIDWGSDDHYLNVQINIGGGLTDMGTTQFKPVPYALHAKTIDNPSSGLEALDEGNGVGWRLIGSNPINFGNIGEFATDLSYSNTASDTRGATGDFSIALGFKTTASGLGSFAAGNTTRSNSYLSFVAGLNNIGGGDPLNWLETDPLFEIGNGFTSPSNALTVLKNGKVGIGSDSPGSLLHLFSTENVSTGISIGSDGLLTGQQSYLELITQGDGTKKLGDPNNKGWHLTGRSASYGNVAQRNDLLLSNWDGLNWKETIFFDTTGNIGIGNTNPTSALEIQGELELGLGSYSKIKTRNDTAQLQLQSSLTQYKGGYLLMNSAERLDDAGSIYFTHGDFTAPAPESLIRFRYADDGVISNQLVITSTGNIGIGTSDPKAKLHIQNSTGSGDPTSDLVNAFIQDEHAYLEFSGEQYGGITFKDDGASINSGVIYNYLDDKLQFRVGNNDYLSLNDTGYLSLLMGGKLGIGKATPAFPLDVNTSTELRAGYFYNTTNSTQTSFGLYSGAHGTGSGDKRGGSFESVGGSGDNIGVKGYAGNGTSNIGVYGSASGGTTNWAGYFDSGNVFIGNKLGIGTSSPSESLHISGGDIKINGSTPWIYLDNTSTGNNGIYFENGNTPKSQIFYNGTQDYLYFGNHLGGEYIAVENGAGVGINTTTPAYDFHVVGNSSSDIVEFYNSSTNSGADVIRAKINSATPATLQYYLRCVDGNGGVDGGVRANGSGGVQFSTTSDGRLKMNIKDFIGALNILDKVQPRQYEMKQNPGIKRFGFVAQELNKIYPIAVAGDESSDPEIEPMMVDYSKLTPLLAGATKELHEKVKEQQVEIDLLKQELEAIKKLLEKN